MGQAQASDGRLSQKFLLTLAAAGIASAAAVGVLYAVHAVQVNGSASRSAELTAAGDALSAEERRELTRQMLKARRENPEIPAQVRPTPSSRPATSGTADAAAPAGAPGGAAAPAGAAAPSGAGGAPGAKTRLAVGTPPGPAPGQQPVARGATRKPDAPVQTVALPPATSPPASTSPASSAAGNAPGSAPAPAPTGSVALPPVVVSTPGVTPPPGLVLGEPNALAQVGSAPAPAAAGEPERRGFAASVFSTISGFAGTAANATGNTVNWVIDLPGKAISAGGRLIGGDSASPHPPPAAPPAQPPTEADRGAK